MQTDKGVDVIVENLANVNIDKDLELAGLNGRISVSTNMSAIRIDIIFPVSIFYIADSQYLTTESAVEQHNYYYYVHLSASFPGQPC